MISLTSFSLNNQIMTNNGGNTSFLASKPFTNPLVSLMWARKHITCGVLLVKHQIYKLHNLLYTRKSQYPTHRVYIDLRNWFLKVYLPGDFGSVIIHGGVDIHKTATKTPVPTSKDPSFSSAQGHSLSTVDRGEDSVSPWYFLCFDGSIPWYSSCIVEKCVEWNNYMPLNL